jgi:hypothetical protein
VACARLGSGIRPVRICTIAAVKVLLSLMTPP